MEDLDTNKLIAAIITENIDNLLEASNKFIADKANRIKARLSHTFSEYIHGIERKYSSTKTIIYRDTPQPIKLFYEPIDLINDRTNLGSPDVFDLLAFRKPIIITGTGGSGKSTFLKHLLLNALETTKLIPIFVELRNVEQAQTGLMVYICKMLQLHKVELGEEYLDQAFTRGNFLFLLDGFDELSSVYSHIIGNEMENICQLYSKCHFIITSRPGQEFISWSSFLELRTQPLTLEKAISLIERLYYDEEIKTKFITELQKSLFDSHRSFFENPLLLSIMLITYRDSAFIPSELHNFYSLAFEALYYRHDAAKSFTRPTLTELPINKGKDILAAFSIITYLKAQTSFTDFELKDQLTKAMKLADCECNLKNLITDLLRAFCMLLQDGTMYEYTHRSFQEYFAACYLVSANETSQVQLIAEFSKKADTDLTLQLTYGMNPRLIEEKLIMPFLSEFKTSIGFVGKVTGDVFKKFAELYFDRVNILRNRASLFVSEDPKDNLSRKRQDLQITRLILKLYNISTRFDETIDNKLTYSLEDQNENDVGLIKEEMSISEALENPDIFKWLQKHSLEARVLSDLMKLEISLQEKNKQNDLLFDSLFQNAQKTQ